MRPSKTEAPASEGLGANFPASIHAIGADVSWSDEIDWSDEETGNPLLADDRNFYELEK